MAASTQFHASGPSPDDALLAACVLAYGVATLFRVPEGYWSLVTAIVVMQPDLSHTLAAGPGPGAWHVIGAVVGVGLIALREQGLPTLPLFVAGLVPLACLTAMQPATRMAGVTLVVVFLIPAAGDPYGRPLFRVLDIFIGVLACLLISVLIFRHETAKDPAPP